MLKFPVAIVRATSKHPNASWQTFSTLAAERGSSIGMEIMLDTTNSSEDRLWILQQELHKLVLDTYKI